MALEPRSRNYIWPLDHVIGAEEWVETVAPRVEAVATDLLNVVAQSMNGSPSDEENHQLDGRSTAADRSNSQNRSHSDTADRWPLLRSKANLVSEFGFPEDRVGDTVAKRFESEGRKGDAVGFYLSIPTDGTRAAIEHPNRGREAFWKPTKVLMEDMPFLYNFIETHIRGRVLKEIGRVWLICDRSGKQGVRHVDHRLDFANDFVWLRTSRVKGLRVYECDHLSTDFQDIQGYAMWFDARREHQSLAFDADDGIAVSLRIDGVFVDELAAEKDRHLLKDFQYTAQS